jgi:cytochrome c oxidase cbb3-type subunit 3
MSEIQDKPRDNQAEYVPDTIKAHVYDGIEEFDNKLPNWWLWIMYGTVAFGLLYWIVFHTLEVKPLPREKFALEMMAAQEAELARMEAAGVDNDMLLAMTEMPAKVAEGRELFVKHCVACHLDDGRGLVGPNLTDDAWIHGCQPMDMLKTVSDGVAAKGMPSWANQLGPSRMQAVVSYVLTIRDTNVAGGKAPEGEPCTN